MKKSIYLLMALVLGTVACNNADNQIPVNKAKVEIDMAGTPPCNCEVEMACVKGDEAGTKCVNGVGKCRLFNACRPVATGIIGIPSMDEIEAYSHEHASWMVANGFYLQEDYEVTRQAGEQSLLDFYYSGQK
jgi:hypothetical protein